MSRWLVDFSRRSVRWLPAATIAVLAPKCVACLVAYWGVGAAAGVGFGARELCGAPSADGPQISVWLAVAVLSAGLAGVAIWRDVSWDRARPTRNQLKMRAGRPRSQDQSTTRSADSIGWHCDDQD
jgi:hypothetical protein